MKYWLSLLALAVPALGHEFWIEPSTFAPAPGQSVAFRLRVGDGFPGEPFARNPKHIRRFVIREAGSERPVPGAAGRDPAGHARVTGKGLAIVGYRSHPTRIELPAAKFNRYLEEEGLKTILDLRRKRNDLASPGREIYSRCAKALLASGPGRDERLGFDLEIVAEDNPHDRRPGEPLTLRVFHQGSALPGALVRAFESGHRAPVLEARTGPDGRATVKLPRRGVWMLGVVHMKPAPKDANADWESLWASLTFQLGKKNHAPETN